MDKQTEGDNRQRRARARDAREKGQAPSEAGVTTGASKQRRHLGRGTDHAEKVAGPGWGKQQPERAGIDPRPGSVPREQPGAARPATRPEPDHGRHPGDLDEREGQAFEAIVQQDAAGGTASLAEIVRRTGLSDEEASQAVANLVHVHDVVVELPAEPQGTGGGPVYALKARAG